MIYFFCLLFALCLYLPINLIAISFWPQISNFESVSTDQIDLIDWI